MRKILVAVLACSTLAVSAQRLDTWNTRARERSQVLNSAAVTALCRRQDAAAISLLMKATAADPSDPIPLNTLAFAFARQGKHEEALDALRKSHKLERSSAETLLTVKKEPDEAG